MEDEPKQSPPIGEGEHEEARKAGLDREVAIAVSSPTIPAPPPESLPPKRDSFAPGMIIAEKYVVERIVGEGGIGVVVAAKHLDLEQTVAIKYLGPKAVGSLTASDRFLREARLAAKIRSEHVVRVYDVGRLADGTPYMVMEYLAGTDLGRLLAASGPLSVERAIDYVLQACEALAEAHIAGIVHRDLKPDNLFVAMGAAGKSVVKILDFGISKLSAKRTTSGQLAALTQADDKFGTPVYMSPEQLRSSGDVDARADVWAIGVVLYELLTGRLPFDGDDLPELCTAILTMPPVPLGSVRSSLPTGLQEVIERCLAKERDERFQNVAELAQELAPFASASARPRVDHVVRVIREAGESVRPPTPVPDGSSARALHDAATLPAADTRGLLTTGSGASLGAVSDWKAPAWKQARFVIPAAAALLTVVALALVRVGASVPEPAPATASQRVQPTALADAPAAEPPAAKTDPAPVPPEPPVASATAATAALPVAARPPGAATGKPRSAPSASAKRPAPAASAFDSTGVINPFQ